MDDARDCISVDDFCRRNGLCRATLYNLLRAGRGPRTLKIGARRLITLEAARDWRERMEVETAEAEAATTKPSLEPPERPMPAPTSPRPAPRRGRPAAVRAAPRR